MTFIPGNLIDGDYDTTVKAQAAGVSAQAPRTVPVAPTKSAPRKSPPKKSPPTTKKSGSSSRSSGSGSSGSSGSSAAKVTSDKPQVAALEELLKSGFASARDTKLGNVKRLYDSQDSDLLKGYSDRVGSLVLAGKDNDKAEAGASFSNLANRAREAGDMMAQAAAQGAGETDALKAQLMAVRNWASNQSDVNRSYFDTARSVNSAVTDLNADTRSARMNLAVGMMGDQEQVWANYYNQRADAYTQLGNIRANPYSDSYKKGATDYANMAKEAGTAWKNPGVDSEVQNWNGTVQASEARLNNTAMQGAQMEEPIKRPEGSTLRQW